MRLLIIMLIFAINLNGASVQKKDKQNANNFVIEKIFFDDHTYIHYWNKWSHADNGFMHDPSCKCVELTKEKIVEIVELILKQKEEKK